MLYPVLQDPLRPVVGSLFDRPRGASIGQMLFGAGEQGGWYDVSDMSALFQDAAGTTPVTAVEQPVGRILDKSWRGNHATQATTTKRPVLSRRVNLLTKTENFDDAVWTKSGGVNVATVTSNTGTAPDGTLTADTFVATTAAAYIVCSIANQSVIPGMKMVAGIYTKSATRIIVFGGATLAGTDVYSIETLAGGWYLQQVVRTFTVTATGTIQHLLTGSYTGAGSYVIWGASLTHATDAHLPYQRVNTATDYDADPSKFPAYLRFDGVDDALQTGNIDFTSTDKMTVWAGVTKLSDAGLQMISELSTDAGSTSGSFWLLGGDNSTGAPGWGARAGGSTRPLMRGVDSVAPINSVLTLTSDISGSVSSMRSNDVLKATATSTHGTGSFASAPLFIGARDGTSLYFNGRLYSLIVRGDQSSLSQIEATELYIKQKMRLP